MQSKIKETREVGKPKKAWEMTFEEFSKKTTAYDYRSSYGGNYQETYIGFKNNEDFAYFKQELKEFDKKSLRSKNINDRKHLVDYLNTYSLHVHRSIKKTYLSIAEVKKMAHKEAVRKALLLYEEIPDKVLDDYPEFLNPSKWVDSKRDMFPEVTKFDKFKVIAQSRATSLSNLKKQR